MKLDLHKNACATQGIGTLINEDAWTWTIMVLGYLNYLGWLIFIQIFFRWSAVKIVLSELFTETTRWNVSQLVNDWPIIECNKDHREMATSTIRFVVDFWFDLSNLDQGVFVQKL